MKTAVIAFELGAVAALRALAKSEPIETCAAGFVAPAGVRDGSPRYVVRRLEPVPESAYVARGPAAAILAPEFCLKLANTARAEGLGVLLGHTHPGVNPLASFSVVDDGGERPLADYFSHRIPGSVHWAAMFTHAGVVCRELGQQSLADVQLVGREIQWHSSHDGLIAEPDERFARQVLAFGPAVQNVLQKIRVAIVGLGGTGSFIANELAHLGAADYLLVDPDIVETSNLNRLLGSTREDLGANKAAVLSLRIQSVNPKARCDVVVGDVVDQKVAARLLDVDFIFLCTDSHASRAVINQLAYQYLIPCVDMGVAIHAREGVVAQVVGRAQMLASGLPCLVCAGWIDPNQVRLEMMSAASRTADPYFVGAGTPQPAVISLNGTVASVAVTMFLAATAALPCESRMALYDAIRGSMRPTVMSPCATCVVCSSFGALARGDTWSLPTRHQ